MEADEILDGLALWDEHKPQTGEDWVRVAERFIAAGETTEESSPLFAAVVQAVREKLAADQQRDHLRVKGGEARVHLEDGRPGKAHALLEEIRDEEEIEAAELQDEEDGRA